MNHVCKRGFSLLLVLAMLVSLFAGLTITASAAQPTSANDVNYVTSGQYVYNWGKRDTVATFLTTYANSYYTGDYTYEKLSALSGNSGTGTAFYTSAMGTAIHNMLVAKQKSTTSYDAVKTLFQYTECEESSKTQISSFYSGTSMGSTWGNGWNREHTWPNSKGLNGSDENDVLMLKPTLESENSSRGNTAYGNSYYDPNSNGQQLHGDVARMMLQHLMRWGNTSYFYGASGVMESRAVLLEWMEEDPVDTWEMGRNDAVQQITGVRNVFVDYPELAFLLLGEDVPANYPTPSQSGGTVTPAQEYTVTFNVPNGVTRPASVTASRVTLPTPTGTPSGDYTYTFKGWVEASVDNETAKPANIHAAGEQLALSKDTTLYALYTYTAGGTGGSSNTFNKITTEGELADGASYVFVSTVTGKALSQDVASNWAKAGGSYSGDSVSEPAATDVWTVSGGVISCSKGNLYSSAAKAISISSSTTTWTFTVSGGAWTIASGNNVMSYNSSGWRPYSGGYGSDKTFYIYKSGVGGGTTYYTTVIGAECNHTYTTVVTAPTCTADGYTTYTCSKCGFSYTDDATTALGHAYGTATSNGNGTHTAACSRCGKTVTEDCTYTTSVSGAVTTYTCTVCGAVYTHTADTFTVTLNDRGTTSTLSCIDGESVELPNASTVDGFTFAGWVTSAIAEETTAKPVVLSGSYKPTANITLYAAYSRTEEGAGSASAFSLATAASDIADGSYVLIVNSAKDGWYAIKKAADGSGYVASAAADAYIGGDEAPATINVTDDSIIWTLAGNSNGFTLKNVDGTSWLSNSSNSLYYSNTNTAASFKATLRSDNETFTLSPASGRYMGLRSDLAVGSTGLYRFRCNSSASNADYYFYLYKNGGGSGDLIYYTTNPVAAVTCDHANAYDVAEVSATCTEAGTTAGRYCPDCEQWLSGHTELSALGHDLNEQTTPATCTADGATVTSCSRCDYSETVTIPALGHSYDNGVITTAPTATAPGVMTYTCLNGCGSSYTSAIPALGEKIPYTRATEITSGNNYIMAFHYTYNGADKWYGIGGVNNSACTIYEIPAPVNNIVSLDNGEAFLWTIDAVSGTDSGYTLKNGNSYLKGTSSSTNLSTATTAVTWTAADGKADGTFWFKISTRAIGLQSGSSVKNYAVSNANNTGTSYVFDIYLFTNTCAHANTELQGAIEATCTTNGYTGDVVCLDCGAVVTTGTKILQGHDYVEASRTEATCETAGNIHYECSRCDSVKDVAIEALGHDYQQSAHADATCTADGYTTYVCSHDANHTYTDTIPALGHDYDSDTGICANCGDQLSSYTVSFVVPEGINAIDPITAFDGTKISLPEPTGTLAANAEEYIFAGWTTADVEDATDADFLNAGEYTVTGNITLKALYAWVGSESFGGDSLYKLMTESDLASLDTGWMLIIANDGKWQSKTMALADYTSGGNEKFAGRTVTVTNNTIKISASSDVQEFTVIKDADTGFFYLVSNYTDADDTLYYLTSCTNTANANNITLTSNPTAAALWDISYHDDGTVKLTAQGSWTANTVQFNSSNYNGFFSCYGETYYGNAPSNIYGIRLFASNAIYHFTTEPVQTCEHENVTWTDNEDGTCTGICDDCGHIAFDHQTHAWVLDEDAEGTVAATCTADGKAGYVCSNCAATKLEDTEALGHDYVGTETAAPTCSAAGVMTYTCSRCDDTYEEAIPAGNHNFEDGTCTMCGASLYVLVTEAPANWEGEYLIVYVGKDDAKVFDGKHDAAANYTVGTFYGPEGSESSLICVPNPDDYTMIFDPNTDGTYGIMNSDADWWSYKDAKNGFSVSTNTSFAGKYSISLDANGNAVIKNAGNYSIKFNTAAAASGGDRFRFYGTSVYTTVKLYEKYGSCHHDWVLDEDASTPATCGKAGTNVYECSICHETKNETVPALTHDYYYVEVAPTCLGEGWTECYCHNCDYAEILDYTITEPLGHDFSKLVEDEDHYIAPTCTEEGLAVYQCSRCDAFDTEAAILDPLGHDYVDGVCSRCGDELDGQTYTLMTSLDFANAGSVIMVIKYEGEYYALSEEQDGKYLVCKPVTVTNNTITVYDDGTYAIVMPIANCSDGANTGYGFETAERNYLHINSKAVEFAHETTNAALAITQAEVWNGEWDSHDNPIMKKVPNAWFLQGMETGKYISNYIDTYEDTELSVIDDSWFAVPIYFFASSYTKPIEPEPSTHNLYHFEGWPATCTDDGYAEYYTCLDNDCECAGRMYADPYCTIELTDITIPALGHDYRWDGDMGDGSHFMVCSRCEDFYLEDCDHDGENGCCSVCGYAEAAEVTVKIESAALRLGENIDLLYTVSVPEGATDVYMEFTMNGKTVKVYADENGRFAFTDINPQCMGDDIDAKLYATVDGKTYTADKNDYSVREYCVNTLEKTDDAKLIKLLSDTLAYGAAAQTYVDYKTNALVTEGVSGTNYSTYTDLSGLTAAFEGTAADDICWIGAGLKLTDNVAMTFRFYAKSTNGLRVTVAINGREETFTEFTALGNDLYEITFGGIKADEFADDVTASFYVNNVKTGNTVSYSVNTYICAKQNDSDANLAALVKALYNYGASAKAYAAK